MSKISYGQNSRHCYFTYISNYYASIYKCYTKSRAMARDFAQDERSRSHCWTKWSWVEQCNRDLWSSAKSLSLHGSKCNICFVQHLENRINKPELRASPNSTTVTQTDELVLPACVVVRLTADKMIHSHVLMWTHQEYDLFLFY